MQPYVSNDAGIPLDARAKVWFTLTSASVWELRQSWRGRFPRLTSGLRLPPGQAAINEQNRTNRRLASERELRALARTNKVAGQKARYLKEVAQIGTMSGGCRAAHVDKGTVLLWRVEDPQFCIEEERARETLIDSMEAEAYRRGVKGTQRPVYQGGELAGYVTEYSDLLLQLLLRANRPDKYREKNDIQVAVVIKSISGVSPADVL